MFWFLNLCVLSAFAFKFPSEKMKFPAYAEPKIVSTLYNTEVPGGNTEFNGEEVSGEEFLMNERNIIQLRDILQTHWFEFVLVLVDDSEEVLQNANIYLKPLINLFYEYSNFALMKFNTTGVSPILANSSLNKQHFLQKIENSNKWNMSTVYVLKSDNSEGSVLFYSILKAIPLMPKNSAILVFTNREVEDNDLAQLTWKELLENQIRLYVIWNGIYPTLRNEEKVLRETAILSHGNFFVSSSGRNLSKLYSDGYVKNSENALSKSLIALKTNVMSGTLQFPIDTSVKNIHISTTLPLVLLELISPQGYVLNLLNNTEVERFSKGSFATSQPGRRDVQLNTVGHLPTSISGIWRLDIDSNALNLLGCNVTVAIQTHLNVTAVITEQLDVKNRQQKKIVKITVPNEFTNIEKINLYNKWGTVLKTNVSFDISSQKGTKPYEKLEDLDLSYNPKFDIEFNDIPKESFYVKVSGKDQEGNAFSRISYLEREKVSYLIQPLSVEIGAGSELLVRPNQQAKIYFEVTNNRDNLIFANFMCQDEKSLLQQMQPRSAWLNPKQTTIVTVQVRTSSSILSDYRNLITFNVLGPERAQKSAHMFVTNSVVNDHEEPRLTHRYTSDCTNILLGDCEDGTWTIEVIAEDRDSGLMQLSSNPKSLYFPNNYIAGTREPVLGLYGGSCCQSKIQLTAIDLSNNRRTYTADAYHAPLSAGSISAIVLGIFILIIIIIIIIVVSKRMCKKKQSVDLPVYSSPHGNTRER